MIDDRLSLKTTTIERLLSRARDEYRRGTDIFPADLSRQDTAPLSIIPTYHALRHMGQT